MVTHGDDFKDNVITKNEMKKNKIDDKKNGLFKVIIMGFISLHFFKKEGERNVSIAKKHQTKPNQKNDW